MEAKRQERTEKELGSIGYWSIKKMEVDMLNRRRESMDQADTVIYHVGGKDLFRSIDT